MIGAFSKSHSLHRGLITSIASPMLWVWVAINATRIWAVVSAVHLEIVFQMLFRQLRVEV